VEHPTIVMGGGAIYTSIAPCFLEGLA